MAARSIPSSPTISSSASSVKAANATFSSSRAQKWVLTSAMVTALVYLVRHLVEGETSPAPATSTARQFLGQGTPPSFPQWILAYSIGYGMLALLAVAAPEIAAGLAMFGLAVVFLESGGQLATDLQDLEHGTAGTGNQPVNVSTLGPSGTGEPYGVSTAGETAFGTPTASSLFGNAPSPASVGAAAAKLRQPAGLSHTVPDTLQKAAAAEGLHFDPVTDTYVY